MRHYGHKHVCFHVCLKCEQPRLPTCVPSRLPKCAKCAKNVQIQLPEMCAVATAKTRGLTAAEICIATAANMCAATAAALSATPIAPTYPKRSYRQQPKRSYRQQTPPRKSYPKNALSNMLPRGARRHERRIAPFLQNLSKTVLSPTNATLQILSEKSSLENLAPRCAPPRTHCKQLLVITVVDHGLAINDQPSLPI